MMNVVCLHGEKRAGARTPLDCAVTGGQHGKSRSSLEACVLPKVAGWMTTGATVQKPSRALWITLICASVALVELMKNGGVPAERHSSAVVHTGCEYPVNRWDTVSGFKFYGSPGLFFGVEAANATVEKQPETQPGPTTTLKNWSFPNTDEHTEHPEDHQGQAFTRMAFATALSSLESERPDSTDAGTVGRERLERKRNVEGHVEQGMSIGNPVDTELSESVDPWAEERAEMREVIQSQEVVSELLPRLRRQHWLTDENRAEIAAQTLPRHDELLTVVDGGDSSDIDVSVDSDVGETVEEPIVPTFEGRSGMEPRISDQRGEARVLAVPPVAVLVTVLLIAVALALAQAKADPDELLGRRVPLSVREGRRGYVLSQMERLEETIARDYLDGGDKDGAQHVDWIRPTAKSGSGARQREREDTEDFEQGGAVGSTPMSRRQKRSFQEKHRESEAAEPWEEHARPIGSDVEGKYRDKDAVSTSEEVAGEWIPDEASSEYETLGAHHG